MDAVVNINKEVICGVYMIKSPSGKVYIGSSKNINNRFGYYKGLRCKCQTKLYHSLKKYGPENHEFTVLMVCPFEELYKHERELGLLHDVLGENGLNLQLPKYGDLPQIQSEETKKKKSIIMTGRKFPEETCKKISERLKGKNPNKTSFQKGHKPNKTSFQKGHKLGLGRKVSEEQRKQMSLSRIGIPLKPETIEKIRKANIGRKFSEEVRQKVRLSRLGKPRSEETKRKLSIAKTGVPAYHNMTKVTCFIGDEVIYFDSLRDAANHFGIIRTSIGNCMRGDSKSVNTPMGKAVFKYKEVSIG
jgi:group I intron endonuclease